MQERPVRATHNSIRRHIGWHVKHMVAKQGNKALSRAFKLAGIIGKKCKAKAAVAPVIERNPR